MTKLTLTLSALYLALVGLALMFFSDTVRPGRRANDAGT